MKSTALDFINIVMNSTAVEFINPLSSDIPQVCGNAFGDIFSQYYLQTDGVFFWYAAPEIWDRHYTKKCDVYSMGVMFAAMLDRTITTKTVDRKPLLVVCIQGEPVADVQLRNPEINLADHIMIGQPDNMLKQIILRMMAYDYHARPTAAEVNTSIRQTQSEPCTLS
ncbi:serine/threonine-protein kinase pdik1l-B-like [Branchiostoma floridae]|uniref:Serine/threonine-protein kinase pdik1l-B-like n=1 Tax=Branchiostoma floridae TaxID=7739 RepID=A0A9J7L9E2_BRAFL|nr:serine/threonine-protein kinase pdik1l-B-like [Branchiostoma floridae]